MGIGKRKFLQIIGLPCLLLLLPFVGPAFAQLGCSDIGGDEDPDGNCVLSATFTCSGDTVIDIAGDLTVTGAIDCDGADADGGPCTAGFNLTLNVGGDLAVTGSITANGGAGVAGAVGVPGGDGSAGCPGGVVDINVGDDMDMTAPGLIEARGGPGGAGGNAAFLDGGAGGAGAMGGTVDIFVAGAYTQNNFTTVNVAGGAGGAGGNAAFNGNGGNGNDGAAGGTVTLFSCLTVDDGIIGAAGGAGGAGGTGAGTGNGGSNGSGGNGGTINESSGADLTLSATAVRAAQGASEGRPGTGGTSGQPGQDVATPGNGGTINLDRCADFIILIDTDALFFVEGGAGTQPNEVGDPGVINDDLATADCCDCAIEITKSVALDDDCDGVADDPIDGFQGSVIQDEGKCVVYEICVTNSSDSIMPPPDIPERIESVVVDDTGSLTFTGADFGDLDPGQAECQQVPSQIKGNEPGCDTEGQCLCEAVEGMDTASIVQAFCADNTNACDNSASVCQDDAEVDCLGCSVDIQKTVAKDDNCDGVADGNFFDGVTQDPNECVVYRICVTNTGEQELDTAGVQVNDADLGVVDLDFGTISVGAPPVCQQIPVPVSAAQCPNGQCICTDVEGINTAIITSAVCQDTGTDACDSIASNCEDDATVECASCSVNIEKTVALDDNCDGIADDPDSFSDMVTQDPDACVVYQICVSNTGEQTLNTAGVQVKDDNLGIVDLDFGTIGSGAEQCRLVPSQAAADQCPGGQCVCEDIEGTNTAVITSAVCQDTAENACDSAASKCDDNATVECAACSVNIEKTVALDDNCDGMADDPDSFSDRVTQDPDACVVYQICVSNTGEQTLDTAGVQVNDDTLGIVDLDFGTIGPGAEQCRLVPSQAAAVRCPDDQCLCSDVEGINTAIVTSAVCQDTGAAACIEPDSLCEDTAEVECVVNCSLDIEKTCFVVQPPPSDFVCRDAKPITELTMIWNGTEAVTVTTPGTPGVFTIGPGEEVTVGNLGGLGNDIDWQISGAAVNGISTFHVSCSDGDMNGPEDCGKLQGDGKNKNNRLNFWIFEGMAGDLTLDCSPEPPVSSSECTFSVPPPPHCTTKVMALTLRNVGGECADSSNGQWESPPKADECSGSDPGEDVSITITKDPGKVFATPDAGINTNDGFTLTKVDKGEIKELGSETKFDATGSLGTQSLKIHTSCSQPLNLGDRFGAFEVFAIDRKDVGLVSLAAEVVYTYAITNVGTTTVTVTSVDDSELGELLAPDTRVLDLEEETTLTTSTVITETTTNEVSATGNVGTVADPDAPQCMDVSAAKVTLVPPPPPPFVCNDAKPITELTMIWNGTEEVTVTTPGTPAVFTIGPGEEVTVGNLGGLGNDIDWQISGVTVNGISTFHVSCSDGDMNGPEDCGKPQGDGKNKDNRLNLWIFRGMAGDLTLDCSELAP